VNPALERREVHFSGRVQGVGFRYTTRAIAGRHPVRGFVQNLSDGRVRLIVEGTPHHLDALLADLNAEMDRYIESTNVAVLPASGEFSDFEIRHY
jgi:acylphosphatase